MQDPYKPIRKFIDGYNERRAAVLIPGRFIVIDEAMCAYKGAERLFKGHPGTIHITKIPRKPKGVGIELKASADGETGCLLQLEMQEGQVAEAKKFQRDPDNLPFHCAIVLRLTEKYFGTGRVVVGDAAFGSYLTASTLLSRGLFSLFVVKTCTSGFPNQYLLGWGSSNPDRGESIAVTTGEGNMFGVGWISKPGMLKRFVCTCSTTLEGKGSAVHRTKREIVDGIWQTNTIEKTTRRPKCIEELFWYFSAIDFNDRLRQGYLALELSWVTTIWWHRLFATLIGMSFSCGYLAYCWEWKQYRTANEHVQSFAEFVDHACHGLIFNTDERSLRSDSSGSSAAAAANTSGSISDLSNGSIHFRRISVSECIV